MQGKSIPTIANPSTCLENECEGCDNCPDPAAAVFAAGRRAKAAIRLELLTGAAERMEDSAARTAAFLDLDLFPTEHPDAKEERQWQAIDQDTQLAEWQSIQSDAKRLLSQNDSTPSSPDGIDYEPAKAPITTRCPNAGWTYGERHCVAGTAYRTPQPCGKDTCPECAEYNRFRKLEQYGHGIAGHPEQTRLIIGGLPNDDAAAAARNYIAKRLGNQGPKRFTQLNLNADSQQWEAVITFAGALVQEDFDSPAKVVRLAICLKQQFEGCTISMTTKPIPAFRLERHFYTSKKTPSGHIASGFSHGWIQPRKPVDLYQYGEIEIGEVADGMPAVRVDKHRCDTCEGIEKQHHEHPEEMAAAFANEIVDGMAFDGEAMGALADALNDDNVDVGIFALLRAVPSNFPYDKRRLIMDTARHISRDADGIITLLPSARLAHVQVWRRVEWSSNTNRMEVDQCKGITWRRKFSTNGC